MHVAGSGAGVRMRIRLRDGDLLELVRLGRNGSVTLLLCG